MNVFFFSKRHDFFTKLVRWLMTKFFLFGKNSGAGPFKLTASHAARCSPSSLLLGSDLTSNWEANMHQHFKRNRKKIACHLTQNRSNDKSATITNHKSVKHRVLWNPFYWMPTNHKRNAINLLNKPLSLKDTTPWLYAVYIFPLLKVPSVH